MKKNLLVSFIAILILFLGSCSNDGAPEEDPTPIEVVPPNDNNLTEILVFPNGTLVKSANLPVSSSTEEAPVISNIDTNLSYSSGSKIILAGDFYSPSKANIKGVYVQVKDSNSYYDVTIDSDVNNGLISLPIGLPSVVEVDNLILVLKFYDKNGKISAITEINVTITKPDNCDTTKVSGGHGITSNIFTLPETSGQVKISYETYTVKDKIDVFQNGIWIGGTGSYTERVTLRRALNCSAATEELGYVGEKGEFLFDYNPSLGKEIEVVVSGCEMGGTKWEYEFSSPRDFTPEVKFPIVTTAAASLITPNSATTGGIIDLNGGSAITERGVVWDVYSNPTTNLNTKVIEANGNDTFASNLGNLLPNTTYYIRAYAVNSDGTFYGNEISFTTSPPVVIGFSLDGKWLSSAGVGIIISGNSATLYAFSPNWEIAKNKGYVDVGSVKMKDISKVNNTKWNCKDLYLTTTNGQIDGVTWSFDGTITMSSDGKSITATSTGPVSGNVGSIVYDRVD